MKKVDLHTHSTASDGTLTPTELVIAAKKAGLYAIALTDHDSVSGVDELMEAGIKHNLRTVAGVELSTEYEDTEIHVVGLFIDTENAALLRQLREFRLSRDNRNQKMIGLLREEGFQITAEEVLARNPDAVIARPHIARFLVDTHQAKDIQEVFDKYIGEGCRCYVERYKITPMRAVELIHAAGGAAILAHPCLYKISDDVLNRMLKEMKTAGLDGIEAIYSRNQGSDEEKYRAIAKKYGLILSGGSDFHGENKPDIQLGTGTGDLVVPKKILLDMKMYMRSFRGWEQVSS
ncbi:MAG: PHP domain-containing protein [Clostridiales bacterium]|nr:PHP domain-containing protein [Clostridiales bacterium]